jgi:hypothetical protein
MHSRWPLLAAVVATCALGLIAAPAAAAPAQKPLAPVPNALAAGDPLAFDPARLAQLERSAAFGHSGALYARSPGGVVETARRVAHWRPQIEKAVAGSGFSPDILEAIIFLESAGRADAIAPGGANSASGLVQIMGYTANDFLGMNVNLAASRKLTQQIAVAKRRGNTAAVRRLEAQRRKVDARFDPPRALAAAVKYLTTARGHLGRNDLAVVSYHMGIGNLQNALRAYGNSDVSYAQLFFDSGPERNKAAWDKLLSLSDDSRHYYFKVLAAQRIMHLYRTDRAQLASIAKLHARKHSHEEVMHPSWRTKVYTGPREIAVAKASGELLPVPDRPGKLHFQISPGMGSLAPGIGVDKRTYRALQPEALAALTYFAQRVQQVGNTRTPLILTSTVRDWRYQSRLMRVNTMAARSYSVHTTGYAFDIARAWNSERQAAAVQFVLDRMVAQGLIAYIKEPHAIHIAVSRDAKVLIPAMLGPGGVRGETEDPPPVPAHEGEHAHPPEEREQTHAAGQGHAEHVLPEPDRSEPVEPVRVPLPAPEPAPAAPPAANDQPVEAKPGFFEQLRDLLGIWTPRT